MAATAPTIWRRSAAAAAAASSSCNAPCMSRQKRHRSTKAFVRHHDRHGNMYYKLSPAKQPRVPGLVKHGQLFEISNLLLDLDAEDSPAARPMSPEDQERIEALWAVSPDRRAAERRVRAMRDQITETRRSMDAPRAQGGTMDPWLISSYDILTTALHGAQHQGVVEHLCRANGVPAHARHDDESLLRWMMLRRQGLQAPEAMAQRVTPDAASLLDALEQARSIGDLRRIIFESLNAGLDPALLEDDFSHPSVVLVQKLRLMLQETPSEAGQDWGAKLQALIFIGNLSQRLAIKGISLGAPMCRLGLQLSAETGAVDASFRYLHHGFADDSWAESPGGWENVLSALNGYRTILSLEPGRSAILDQSTVDHQRVLQLMTGLDANNTLAPESFRRLVCTCIEQASIPTTHAVLIYLTYISILGQLGAGNTVLAEFNTSLPLLLERVVAESGSQPADQGLTPDGITNQFLAIVQASPRIAASALNTSSNSSLQDCVTMDYHMLEATEMGHEEATVGLREEAA